MRSILLVIFFFLNLDVFCQVSAVQSDYAKSSLHSLDSAFKYKKPELKKQFFDGWLEESKKLEADDTTKLDEKVLAIRYFHQDIFYPNTDTVRSYFTYNLYDSITKARIKKPIQWDGCFMQAKYIVLQPNVAYYICHDTSVAKISPSPILEDCVVKVDAKCTFPAAKFFDQKRLYLTPEYRLILDGFTMNNIKKDQQRKLLADDRRVFLQPEIEISKSHDGWSYHLETFPLIYAVYFNEKLNVAVVKFRSSFNTGGFAKYKKIGGYWRREEFDRVAWVQ